MAAQAAKVNAEKEENGESESKSDAGSAIRQSKFQLKNGSLYAWRQDVEENRKAVVQAAKARLPSAYASAVARGEIEDNLSEAAVSGRRKRFTSLKRVRR
eukprot:1180857-Prorocentrum_minimum.AAC.2